MAMIQWKGKDCGITINTKIDIRGATTTECRAMARAVARAIQKTVDKQCTSTTSTSTITHTKEI